MGGSRLRHLNRPASCSIKCISATLGNVLCATRCSCTQRSVSMSYMIGADERGVLKRYARPIVHMRSQITSKRFGLVLGAGVSKPLGFPDWRELVDRIADDPEVDGKHLLANVADRLSETSKTQMLYQHFKSKLTESAGEPYSFRLERKIQ